MCYKWPAMPFAKADHSLSLHDEALRKFIVRHGPLMDKVRDAASHDGVTLVGATALLAVVG